MANPWASLEGASHIVQQALTPVFLLSGVGTLLNVFASRLGRVADQTHTLEKAPDNIARDTRLRILRQRARALDFAVVLGALAGGCTCTTVLVLFLGELLGDAGARLLLAAFGAAILLTMGSIASFVVEMLLAARGVRIAVEDTVGDGEPKRPHARRPNIDCD
jgi:hypothetical protein